MKRVPRAPQVGRGAALTYRISRKFVVTAGNASQSVTVPSTQSTGYGSFDFKLSYVPGVSDLTTLFDQFRIKKVHLHFVPSLTGNMLTNAATGVANGAYVSNFHYCIDTTDATAPTALQQVLRYQGVKTVNTFGTTGWKTSIVPRVATSYYRTATSTAYGPAPAGVWLDKNNTDAVHYGMKWVWESNLGIANYMAVYVTYDIEFKGLQ